jgi:SNF family Na+-dependent transporter
MEWTLGRAAGNKHHGTAPGGFHYILNKKPWAKHLGSLGLLPPLFISFYYIFIQSWILAFTYYSATGKLMEVVAGGYETRALAENVAIAKYEKLQGKK